MKLREYIILFLLLVLVGSNSFSQDMKKKERTASADMRQGNIFYQEEVYPDAEVSYKKAITENPNKPKAVYNLANTMMQQERYKEAVMQYDHLIKNKSTETEKAPTFHNIGNANMSLKDYEKAIEAYKNSLRKNPDDEETRYNLALAQQFLKQQQKNDQNKNDQNKDDKNQNKQDDKKNQDEKKNQKKEKKDNKENRDKDKKEDDNQNKDEEKDKGDKDKKDNNEDEDKNKDEKEKGESQDDKRNPQDEEKDKNQQAQPQPGKLSPQQIRQLLEALNNEEKKTHDKINAKKVKGRPVKTEKDW